MLDEDISKMPLDDRVNYGDFESRWQMIVPNLIYLGRSKLRLDLNDIEDLLQEVAIIALKSIREGRGVRHFDAWCRTVFMNRYFSNLRKAQIASHHRSHLVDLQRAASDHAATSVEDTEALQLGLESLPPRQKDVIQRLRAGQSTQQIAEGLGLSQASVRSLKRYALMLLKNKLGGAP